MPMPAPLPTISAADLQAEVRLYREARVARLTAPNGWLTLVNKTWIDEGVSTMGGDPDCTIALPPDRAPPHLGTFTRAGLAVRFDASPGVEALVRGAPVRSLVLRAEADSSAERIAIGSLSIELIRRGDDLAVRVRDADHPARRSFAGIPSYPADPSFWIPASFEADSALVRVPLTDSDGRPQLATSVGLATFEVGGSRCRLRLFDEDAGRQLFILFGDATNRDETYGAGRFLYASNPVAGRVILDFNKAFNPPCAFTAFAACPLPPPENRLAVRIEAGEKRPPA